ncbi:hypothetical protein OIU79_008889 [Salix purpurea]|uniref:Uncharacterized protein n=1 Tax=Salix purpurea TaxID=77065 RepID=A0A9Q0TJK7_SALPP|nr:hypothetical protein OIU79_008889 [Salix purpurea]
MPLLIDFPPVLPADFCWTGRGSCRTRIIQYTGGLRALMSILSLKKVPACIVTCGGLCRGINTGGYGGSYLRYT